MCNIPNQCAIEILGDLFVCDADGGRLLRKIARGNRSAGSPVGVVSTHGYRNVQIDGKSYGVHRVIWAMHYGTWPTIHIDHIDGNRSNNRISNLRITTVSQNLANSKQYKRRKQLPRGVYEQRGKITARLSVLQRDIYLGQFQSIEEADAAVKAARLKHFGEFARDC